MMISSRMFMWVFLWGKWVVLEVGLVLGGGYGLRCWGCCWCSFRDCLLGRCVIICSFGRG